MTGCGGVVAGMAWAEECNGMTEVLRVQPWNAINSTNYCHLLGGHGSKSDWRRATLHAHNFVHKQSGPDQLAEAANNPSRPLASPRQPTLKMMLTAFCRSRRNC